MTRRLLRAVLVLATSVLLGGVLWAAFAPVVFDSREELFEIPKGTWARRRAGARIVMALVIKVYSDYV